MSFINKYNGQTIKQKVVNNIVYICATDMQKASKVKLMKWKENQETKETLRALQAQTGYFISNSDSYVEVSQFRNTTTFEESFGNTLVVVDVGGTKGTWFHEDIAIAYAYNCNVDFRLWVINLVKNTLRGKKTLPFASGTHTYIYRPLEEGKSPWELTFEKEFFDQLYALDNRENKEPYHQHPPYMAKYIIKYVYDQLKPFLPKKQVYTEITLLKAHDRPKGMRMLHQYLSPEGRIELFKLIGALTEIFREANSRTSDPQLKRHIVEVKLGERNGQLKIPIYEEFTLKGSQNLIDDFDEIHLQLIAKVVPNTIKSFLRLSAKILEINSHHIIFGVDSRFLKDIGNKQTQAIELAVEAVLKKNLTVMFKTYSEYLFGEDKKENAS